MFWRAEIAPGAVTVLAPAPLPTSDALRLVDLAATVRRRSDEGLHLRLASGAQVLITGHLECDVPLALVLPVDAQVQSRWRSACSALALDTVLAPFTPWQQLRHRRALQALDARRRGASDRQITEALFDAHDLPRGAAWKTDELRAQTLRLLSSARSYVRGAYLRLLRVEPPRRRR